jgi:signal peptidase II
MGRGPVAIRRPGLTLLITAALTLAADQATKAAVRAYLSPARSIPLLPGIFELSYVRNTGAAFGVMQGQRVLFVITTLAVLGGIAFVWFYYRPRGPLVVAALGLVCGGALGNLTDRVTTGRVTDFLYVHFWPVFNLADSAVVVGVCILVVWLLFYHDEDGADADAGSDAGTREA